MLCIYKKRKQTKFTVKKVIIPVKFWTAAITTGIIFYTDTDQIYFISIKHIYTYTYISMHPYLICSSIFYYQYSVVQHFQNYYELSDGHLSLTDFVPKTSEVYTRMVTQGGNMEYILRQIRKVFQRYPEAFSKYY